MEVEFKLFGSLTVRQFVNLSGGIVVAIILYFIGGALLPAIIIYPIIIFSVIIGFALTFVTVNGQPFSRWFMSFLKAVFSSQRYIWKKQPKAPKALTNTFKPDTKSRTQKANKELGSLPIIDIVNLKAEELDTKEDADLTRIDKYFESEFDKYFSKGDNASRVDNQGTRLVNRLSENMASEINPVGRNQRSVITGPNTSQVFTNITNRKVRPFNISDQAAEEKERINQRIKEILERQKELENYIATEVVEKRENELKKEMRKLYDEIKKLKSKQ